MTDDNREPEQEDKDVPPGGNPYPERDPKVSGRIILGGTLAAFFGLQVMGLVVGMNMSEEYRESVMDAITPDFIFGEWETIAEKRAKKLEESLRPKP